MEPPSIGDPSIGDPKPYHCSVCGDDFKRHEHLIRHSRRHTQEKPFKCDICQKEFARRDILSRHAIVHVPAAERAALPQKAQKRGTKRVQQACNNCAKGKCRCDGETPCSTCQSKGLENCEYTLSMTPAKRRRADSSASTAAANVLLQVASSAHASPKGDWSMDYNENPNSISMQPPGPVVFGYQPTFNGAMGHDPFMYNSPKPGSRYASRAPSPSHAFDTPFESALPSASIFGFLFKESNKDLPALNSILSNFLPAPGLIGDYSQPAYGHNGIEQPGTYSNYRNDFLTSNKISQSNTNNNSVTRPPSPTILSFPEIAIPEALKDLEEDPLVDAFTDIDRERLLKFTEMDLPSKRLLNVIIQLYFGKFHESMPIVHRPTYSPGQADHGLTLAIMALGSRYLENGDALARPLFMLADRVLKLGKDTFPALQARFLLDIAELYNIQSQSSLDAVEERRAVLLRNARSRKVFDESWEDIPSGNASAEIRWDVTRRAEERRRLSWGIWLYEHHFRVLFGARPLLELHEIKTGLPCHENLWEANSAQQWAEQFAPDLMPLRTRALLGAGRLEERGIDESSQYGIFCRTVLAHVEVRRVLDTEAELASTHLQPGEDIKIPGKTAAGMTLGQVSDMAEKTFEILEKVLSTESGPESETQDAALNLSFARMAVSGELPFIRQFLVGDDRGVRLWSEQSPSRARAAVLAAAHVTRLLVDRQASPFAGMMAFYATMVLFCYARYYPSNDALHQLQLDQSDFGTPKAKQWIEKGSYIPVVHGIGLVDETNTSRIISSWDNLGIAYWGLDVLRQRLDSLAQIE